jgi:uncharacterized protein (DUF697 family)/predicted GTPase
MGRQRGMNDKDSTRSSEPVIVELLALLDRLPAPVRRKMEKELQDLLALVRDRRPPRFLMVGRRGSGKSSLLNAVFGRRVAEVGPVRSQTGAAEWRRYEQGGRSLDILDTRGLQEGSGPAEADSASNPVESIGQAIDDRPPDAVLFLIKAKEVDSAVAGDLDALEEILDRIRDAHGCEPPVLGVVTQCDEVDPPDVRRLPTDDPDKNRNIHEAVEVLRGHMRARPALAPRLVRVLPTVGYVAHRPDGAIDPERDFRWNIQALVGLLLEELPDQAKLDFARLAQVQKFQARVAEQVVTVCAAVAGGIGAQPLPMADLPLLTSLQTLMVATVAYVAGRDLTLQSTRELLVSLGVLGPSGITLREVARGAVKLVPGFGHAVSGAVAAGGTYVIGRAAILYFIDRAPVAQVREALRMRRIFSRRRGGPPG